MATDVAGDRLFHDPDLSRFYDLENGWTDDKSAVISLAASVISVLDIGCGTGMLAAHLAGHVARVTGLDPASAMLDIARARTGGERVKWVSADARTARLEDRFDLVVMTGHAFQGFLTQADRIAVLSCVARHLTPSGRFVFDSRNPLRREWQDWTPERSHRMITDPELGPVACWNDVHFDPLTAIATYQTVYAPQHGTRRQATSQIAFPTCAEIATALSAAGLQAMEWWGSWDFAPFEDGSPEIIAFGGLAA